MSPTELMLLKGVSIRSVVIGYSYVSGRILPHEFQGISLSTTATGKKCDLAFRTRVRHDPGMVSLFLFCDWPSGFIVVNHGSVPDPILDRLTLGNESRLLGLENISNPSIGDGYSRKIREESGDLRVPLILDDREV